MLVLYKLMSALFLWIVLWDYFLVVQIHPPYPCAVNPPDLTYRMPRAVPHPKKPNIKSISPCHRKVHLSRNTVNLLHSPTFLQHKLHDAKSTLRFLGATLDLQSRIHS